MIIRKHTILTFLAVLFFLSACSKESKAPDAPNALNVSALKITKTDIPVSMEFVGQTKGEVDAEVRARVEGAVTAIHFEEGKEVKEGQKLYSIDPAPYKAKVAEAQGKVAEAETMLVKAESDLKRVAPLVKMKALSERDLDKAVAQQGAAKGSLDAANAALEAANIELGYCEVLSPVTGTIGLTKAKIGEFVGKPPNPVVLNVVSKLNPIHVKFAVSEKDYLYFARMKQKELDNGDTSVKRKLQMELADGSVYTESGEVVSVGREIDPATGTIAVEASFPNTHKLIRPGQFAKIKTTAETLSGAVVVPKRAMRELQGQYQVVVIKNDNTAEPRNVTLGSAVGDKQIITAGLSENEVIALDGLQQLKTGTLVNAKFEG